MAAGLYLGWRAPRISTPAMRLQGFAVWEVLGFLLNATLFILIGLQLPIVLDGLTEYSVAELVGDAAVIVIAVVGIRFAWLFTTPYLIRALDRRPAQRARRVGAAARTVIAWSGLRGAVSLATALALPLETDAGAPLPGRDLVIFVTFVVVLVTVVGQGLTLAPLVRRLGVADDGEEERREEVLARLAASKAALGELDQAESEGWAEEETVERVRLDYQRRKRLFASRAGVIEDDGYEEESDATRRLLYRVYEAEREAVLNLRNSAAISNEVMHRIEHELDLAQARLKP